MVIIKYNIIFLIVKICIFCNIHDSSVAIYRFLYEFLCLILLKKRSILYIHNLLQK